MTRRTLYKQFARKHKGDPDSVLYKRVVQEANDLQEIVKSNIKKLVDIRGISILELFTRVNDQGVAINRTAFYKKIGERQRFMTIYHLSIFADQLGVPVWLLLLPDIESEIGPYR